MRTVGITANGSSKINLNRARRVRSINPVSISSFDNENPVDDLFRQIILLLPYKNSSLKMRLETIDDSIFDYRDSRYLFMYNGEIQIE